MSQYIERQVEIGAPAERVWHILLDFPRFPEWNPFIVNVAGEAVPGKRLDVTIKPPGHRSRRFRPSVLAALPARELRWLGRWVMPGLVDGEHGFRLERQSADRTLFIQHETFSGLLVPCVWWSIRNALDEGFDAMNRALKQRVESAAVHGGAKT
jgi:hypothetical protein